LSGLFYLKGDCNIFITRQYIAYPLHPIIGLPLMLPSICRVRFSLFLFLICYKYSANIRIKIINTNVFKKNCLFIIILNNSSLIRPFFHSGSISSFNPTIFFSSALILLAFSPR